MTRFRLTPLLAPAAVLLMLAACGQTRPNPTPPNYTFVPGPDAGSISSDGGLLDLTFGKGRRDQGGAGAGIGVNAFLWRGALDTLSFMPLASADPFGGVIITDWYTSPAAAGERFKATAYILSRDLRSDGVKVNIFRQVLQGGQWVDAPVSQVTVGDIENKVLDRARRLREQTQVSS